MHYINTGWGRLASFTPDFYQAESLEDALSSCNPEIMPSWHKRLSPWAFLDSNYLMGLVTIYVQKTTVTPQNRIYHLSQDDAQASVLPYGILSEGIKAFNGLPTKKGVFDLALVYLPKKDEIYLCTARPSTRADEALPKDLKLASELSN